MATDSETLSLAYNIIVWMIDRNELRKYKYCILLGHMFHISQYFHRKKGSHELQIHILS